MVDFSRRAALGAGTALFGALNAVLAVAQPAATVKQRPIFSTQQRPKLSSSAAHFRLFFPLLEPEGVIPGFQYVAVMGDAIE